MKANEAPEKIYLQEPTKVRTKKVYDNDVEYIRKDAFIKKAFKWMRSDDVVNNEWNTEEDMYEDFKKYMEG